jgi:copper chaperone
MKTIHLKVTGMTCNHCVKHVDSAIREVQGVQKVDVDLASGEVYVNCDDSASINSVIGAITNDGYSAVEI